MGKGGLVVDEDEGGWKMEIQIWNRLGHFELEPWEKMDETWSDDSLI